METAQSSDSEHSNASSYHSVRVRSSGAVEPSRASVPDSAPELFPGATGMYDQSARTFYAVDTQQQAAARWDAKKGWQWLKDNKAKLAKALVDVAPTLIQGTSSFIPGKAGTIVNGVGIAAQGMVAGQELYGQFQQSRAGGHVDPVQVGASIGRLASAGLNTYGSVADQDATATKMVSGAGTWVAGAATAMDLTHHAHTYPQTDLEQGDAQIQMYGLHNNPQLGNQPGQVPAGWNPSPQASSVTSFSPPASHASRRTTAETSSSAQKAQQKKVVKKSGGGGPSH